MSDTPPGVKVTKSWVYGNIQSGIGLPWIRKQARQLFGILVREMPSSGSPRNQTSAKEYYVVQPKERKIVGNCAQIAEDIGMSSASFVRVASCRPLNPTSALCHSERDIPRCGGPISISMAWRGRTWNNSQWVFQNQLWFTRNEESEYSFCAT